MRQVNKDKSRTIASQYSSSAREYAIKKAKEEDNQLYDILIEAGILRISINGKYQIQTDNYFGSFNVASIPADTGLPGPTSGYKRS